MKKAKHKTKPYVSEADKFNVIFNCLGTGAENAKSLTQVVDQTGLTILDVKYAMEKMERLNIVNVALTTKPEDSTIHLRVYFL